MITINEIITVLAEDDFVVVVVVVGFTISDGGIVRACF